MMFGSKDLKRRVGVLEACLNLTQESSRERGQNSVTCSQEVTDNLDKLSTRIDKLEKVEQDKKDKKAVEDFIASVQAYKIVKGACSRCDGKMKVSGISNVSIQASTRYNYGHTMGWTTIGCLSGCVPNGDDHREVLCLVCEACDKRVYMWTKDVEI